MKKHNGVKTSKDGSSEVEHKGRVSVGGHLGRVEVVFEYKGQRCRLLGDKDGIHVGTVVTK